MLQGDHSGGPKEPALAAEEAGGGGGVISAGCPSNVFRKRSFPGGLTAGCPSNIFPATPLWPFSCRQEGCPERPFQLPCHIPVSVHWQARAGREEPTLPRPLCG